jgi:hypothetical protein
MCKMNITGLKCEQLVDLFYLNCCILVSPSHRKAERPLQMLVAASSRSYQNYQNGAVSNQLTDAGREEDVLEVTVNLYHRLDRVINFFSSRPNWDSPTPSPAGKRVSPLGWGGVLTRLREREWGGPISSERTDTVVL